MDTHSWLNKHGSQHPKSQLGADDWVLGLFGNGHRGYYVDVGAADGIVMSNTAKLEQKGWQGIAVDPLLKNFESRHRTKQYRAAVYSQADLEVEFAVASFDNNLSGITSDLISYRSQVLGSSPQLVRLRTRLLSDVLDEEAAPQAIEYLSLDTEGSELAILSTFPFHRYCFGVISVEHNYEEPKRSGMRDLLARNGYVHAAAVQWDDWYVHQSLAPKLQHMPPPPCAHHLPQ